MKGWKSAFSTVFLRIDSSCLERHSKKCNFVLNALIKSTRTKILIARLLYLITRLLPGKDHRIIKRNGIVYAVDLSEGIDMSIFLSGSFQPHLLKNPVFEIKPDFVIMDIGANAGFLTLQFARHASQGSVIAFEPTDYAMTRLQRNLSLNPELSARVRVIHSFVSDKSDNQPNIKAYSSWKINGERSADNHPVHTGTPRPSPGVPAISLNDFAEKEQLQKVDFIKIDTDGHEHLILNGADRMIARLRPAIIYELGLYVMQEQGITFEFYEKYFHELGYRMFDSITGKEITLANYRKLIPKYGTTDVLALPY
jgi:FkbM family methyltransferase